MGGRVSDIEPTHNIPQQEVTKPKKMEGDLDVLLRISRSDMVWGLVVLGADCKDGEKNGKP